MSKAKEHHGAADHEKTNDKPAGKKAAEHHEASHAPGHGTGEAGAKSEHHKKTDGGIAAGSSRQKHVEALPGNCHAWGCKAKAKQFEFCNEHFDHFKFGLIKKSGEQVSDYEKKIEHYLAYKSKRGAQKAA